MSSIDAIRQWLTRALAARLPREGAEWLGAARAEVAAGVSHDRSCALISLASRYCRGGALAPGAEGLAEAGALVPGWNPERWQSLEAARVALVLERADLAEPRAVEALEEAFRYADVGELCALYKSLAVMPAPERFAWRGGEGCRSNMRSVFESVACDSPFPARVFDELAWRQLCIKAVFIGAPLWRVHGLDGRLSAELARMALDLADERRSAGRPVQPELWLCIGRNGGERARASLERELDARNQDRAGRQAAALALGRAGLEERLRELASGERDPAVAAALREALAGNHGQARFAALHQEP
jgi:hypothetical protein